MFFYSEMSTLTEKNRSQLVCNCISHVLCKFNENLVNSHTSVKYIYVIDVILLIYLQCTILRMYRKIRMKLILSLKIFVKMHGKWVTGKKRETLGLIPLDLSLVMIRHRDSCVVVFERVNTPLTCDIAGFKKMF